MSGMTVENMTHKQFLDILFVGDRIEITDVRDEFQKLSDDGITSVIGIHAQQIVDLCNARIQYLNAECGDTIEEAIARNEADEENEENGHNVVCNHEKYEHCETCYDKNIETLRKQHQIECRELWRMAATNYSGNHNDAADHADELVELYHKKWWNG